MTHEPQMSQFADSDQFIDDRNAASMLGLSRSYMRQLRVSGVGPRYSRLSAKAIRYRVGDLVCQTASNRAPLSACKRDPLGAEVCSRPAA